MDTKCVQGGSPLDIRFNIRNAISMDLIIVESPTKSRTLGGFLDKKYQIVATMGHIIDLPKNNLGIEVENNFKPLYEALAKKKEVISQLKKLGKEAETIYLATDPDREGEAISWHVAGLMKDNKKLKRITFHEITRTAIEKALASPGTINMQLVNAQQARRVLDRLVGYKLSPLLWKKVRRGLSAGRVQSVAVRLIADKEKEIAAFVPEEYWNIVAELKKVDDTSAKSVFLAKLAKKDEKILKVKNKAEADGVLKELNGAYYSVLNVEKKEVLQMPVSPFRTSTLQQKASQSLGFSSKRTMQVAQNLYEQGIITYHRTDSTLLAQEAIGKVREYIKMAFGEKYLSSEPRQYKTNSKVAQEAHEAIRPTEMSKKVENIEGLDRDGQRLYELIWKRTMACQMKEAVWENTKVDVEARTTRRYIFQAEGKRLIFDGWLTLYPKVKDEALETLPKLANSEELKLLKLNSEQKFTLPPARFNEASLIKALEKMGIGRPSTYAPTISLIQLRQYVEKIEGLFHSTALGTTVVDFLVKNFPKLFDYDFTAQMEDELDDIANGKREWVPVVKEFYDPMATKLKSVEKNAERVAVPTEKTGEKCPECKEGDLVIRVGRFGKFISCARFPDCKYTAPYIEKLENVKCPDCGGEVVTRRTHKGKQFFGCANYPKCKWASWRKPVPVKN